MTKYRVLSAGRGFGNPGTATGEGWRRSHWDTIKAKSAAQAISIAKKQAGAKFIRSQKIGGWKAIKVSTRKRTGWNWM